MRGGQGRASVLKKIALDTLAFLIDFLKPFNEAHLELEGDKYPTLNHVSLLDRNAVHAHYCTLLQAMSAGAPYVESQDPELFGV